MKSLFLPLFFSFLVISFIQAQPVKMTSIKGKIVPTGKLFAIYLDSISAQPTSVLAKSTIKQDGSFQLEAPVLQTNIFKLRIDETNFLMLILSPGEDVSITSPNSKLGVDAIISGSKQSEFLYATLNGLRPFEMRRDSLNKQYNTIQSSPLRDSLSAELLADFMKNDSLQRVFLLGQFEKQPSSLAWIFLQDKFDMNSDFAIIDRMEKALYDNYPYNIYIQQYHQQIEVERKTAIGSLTPEITLPDPEGNSRSLTSLKGKVVLIDFWASWCGPCRKENPNVVKAYAKYKDKGFEIFSVSLDKDRDSWLKAISADKLVWPNHVSDLKYWKSEGAAAYGVTSIPFTVLLDKDGRIVAKKLRGEALEQKLSELLD